MCEKGHFLFDPLWVETSDAKIFASAKTAYCCLAFILGVSEEDAHFAKREEAEEFNLLSNWCRQAKAFATLPEPKRCERLLWATYKWLVEEGYLFDKQENRDIVKAIIACDYAYRRKIPGRHLLYEEVKSML